MNDHLADAMPKAVITPDQIKAARALLRWNAEMLAKKADCSVRTVTAVEAGNSQSERMAKATGAIRLALEAAGIEFTDGGQPGVRLREPD